MCYYQPNKPPCTCAFLQLIQPCHDVQYFPSPNSNPRPLIQVCGARNLAHGVGQRHCIRCCGSSGLPDDSNNPDMIGDSSSGGGSRGMGVFASPSIYSSSPPSSSSSTYRLPPITSLRSNFSFQEIRDRKRNHYQSPWSSSSSLSYQARLHGGRVNDYLVSPRSIPPEMVECGSFGIRGVDSLVKKEVEEKEGWKLSHPDSPDERNRAENGDGVLEKEDRMIGNHAYGDDIGIFVELDGGVIPKEGRDGI
ncbi:uncharacterized protein ATNIH1004_007862 [Aspergillus tanneri]|uniref:Uncharacterized protein n=1 Tax=Aspergillus tanneri TaxID=1220188 RepID=A0A5M9MHG7_9EURO|nr:uncharacterized protein ATNIH1004_007862 [Aspergillus tanneri]KAA8646432.1 hypothetical protein ATNIH1004_007862 [Aspergillus tanneri]